MTPSEFIARGRAAMQAGPISNDDLAANTDDGLRLSASERANVAACMRGDLDGSAMTHRELRGVAQSHRYHARRNGLHAR